MNDKIKIDQLKGTNPFKVPEGYFEGFSEELMKKLPAKEEPARPLEHITLWMRVKPWVYMAAMFCFLVVFAQFLFTVTGDHSESEPVAAETQQDEYSDEFVNTVVNNTLIDDYTLYSYLTEAE